MEFNWLAKNHIDIVNDYLGFRNERRPRGVIKQLADRLRCHSTFISQVLSERAHFSPEQGFEVCKHFQFNPEEQEFFLTMLMRDRAGSTSLKMHYQQLLDRLLESKRDLRPKNKAERGQLEAFESEYFSNWLYQAVHALTQVPKYQTVSAIVKVLGISGDEVKAVLTRLQVMGLVKAEKGAWKSTENFLHLAKDSHFIRSLHSTWRGKILADLQNRQAIDGTRYSGLITITEKDFNRTREILARAIGEIRKLVNESDSEEVFVLSLDCYKL